jgi:hypothetical protein
MAALDGLVKEAGAVFEAKFMLLVNRRWIGTPYRHPKGTPLNGEFCR